MEPLTQWICDGCDQIINSPSEGILVWRSGDLFRRSDFKIVHQGCAEFPPYTGGDPLEHYLGTNGASRLMSFIADGPINQNLGRRTSAAVDDLEEFVDLFRRFQIPHYEEARTKFSCRGLLDDYSDYDEAGPYRSEILREIIEREY